MAIAVAGFQTWVVVHEAGVTVSGTGAFGSTNFWTTGVAAASHGYPIGWLTLLFGLIIAGSAALHYGDVLDEDCALKSVVLPGFLSATVTVLAILNKDTLIKVPADQLQGVALDTGTGAIVVLVASIAAVLAGFALSMFDGRVYVPTRPRTSSRPATTRPATRSKPGKKKTTVSKKKAASKKKKKATKKPSVIPLGEAGVPVISEADGGDTTEPVSIQEQVVLAGGSAAQPPIWLTHWCAQLPAPLRSALAVPGVPDAGPVLLLHPGGGVGPDDLIPAMVRAEKPWLLDDLAYTSWQAGLSPIFGELGRKYTVLELVRDDEWLAQVMQNAGIATTSTRVESGGDEHGVYERHITTIDLPVLIGAAVEESGLVLRFASRAVDSADRWSQGLSVLREGFSEAGMDARHLHVVDGPENSIELRFEDTVSPVVGIKE
ncbi:hypothetical protein KC238_13350 [Mycobacteroides chelonae]|uniref:hypothetical protein n=1 Tax=Mycobacteroides chelonae TaxID=1774 RepID=UPI001C2C53CC|nr:hypothetical protein [Mycobacteroides chelonae]MBV0918237.1 hypothetical protein [Mycobacteroides chelonae]UJW66072.1 hypothetical protein H0I67_01100 [Mycobacteroides chelonae]